MVGLLGKELADGHEDAGGVADRVGQTKLDCLTTFVGFEGKSKFRFRELAIWGTNRVHVLIWCSTWKMSSILYDGIIAPKGCSHVGVFLHGSVYIAPDGKFSTVPVSGIKSFFSGRLAAHNA